jgi:cyclase
MFASLRRNTGTFTARGGTMGWLVAPDAVVVIDSQFADTSKMFLEGFTPMTGGRKIDLLINTHHHPDHTGGNKVLQPSVMKMVAQENAPGLQRKQAAAQKSEDAQAYADTTFKTDWKVDLGGEVVSARHYGPGHTGGDAVIFFQRANVVHMGDLMSHQRHPRVDRPAGASIRNWLVSLEKVVKDHNADTIYIFGHSKVGAPVTGPKGDLLALRDYFSAMLDYVQKGIKAGKSADEIVKAGLPQFAANEGQPQLQVAYDELTAKKV